MTDKITELRQIYSDFEQKLKDIGAESFSFVCMPDYENFTVFAIGKISETIKFGVVTLLSNDETCRQFLLSAVKRYLTSTKKTH